MIISLYLCKYVFVKLIIKVGHVLRQEVETVGVGAFRSPFHTCLPVSD